MINFGRWLLLYSAMPFKGFPRNGGGGGEGGGRAEYMGNDAQFWTSASVREV